MIDAFLDGLLSPEEARAVERAASTDPALRDAIELERTIARSIRHQFHPPATISVNFPQAPENREVSASLHSESEGGPIPIERGMSGGARRWTLSRSLFSAAAAIAIVGASLWAAGIVTPYSLLGITPPGLISPESVYERKVATGFQPDWVCTTDAEFEDVARQNFGQALQLPKSPGVEVVGWAYYEPVLSDNTCLLLVKVDGKEAIVVIDFRANSRPMSLWRSSKYSIYSRTFDNVALYQASTKGTRNILPDIYNPDETKGPDGACKTDRGTK